MPNKKLKELDQDSEVEVDGTDDAEETPAKKKNKKLDKKDDKKAKGKKMPAFKEFDPGKYVEVNPVTEAVKKAEVVISFGRMNPITIGHEKVADKVQSIAKKTGAEAGIYLSHSQDGKKNPLSYDQKIKYGQAAFGKIVKKSKSKTIIQVAQELQNSFKNLTVVVGSDRVKEFETLLNKYNGKDYTYDSINVVSAGERDPDAEGAEGMSASKMRKAAKDDDFDSFKKGLPKNLQRKAQEVWDAVSGGMSEEIEVDEALTPAQRRGRAMIMKKNKNKIARSRKINAKKKASPEKLKARAQQAARKIIKKKLSGGKDNSDASYSSRQKIDDRVKKMPKNKIAAIAKKLLPALKKKEQERLKKMRSKKEEFVDETLDLKEAVDAYMSTGMLEEARHAVVRQLQRPHQLLKAGKVKFDYRFKQFRKWKPVVAVDTPEVPPPPVDDRIGADPEEQSEPENMNEGVNDPAIFKAIFLAGGPGSGKSFIVGKSALPALGFRVINSDDAFERAMKKAGLSLKTDTFTDKGQVVRGGAVALTDKRLQMSVNGRLGLVIDGTGKDYSKIKIQADALKKLGYDVSMIIVNTDIETALIRNGERDRSLPDPEVTKMWNEVQSNVGKYQSYFKTNLIVVDNSEGKDWAKGAQRAYKWAMKWSKKEPQNPVAQKWISDMREELEESTFEGSVIDSVVPWLGRWLDTRVKKKAYTAAIKYFLKLRKKKPGEARKNLVKSAQVFDLDVRALDKMFRDLVAKGAMPKHLIQYHPTFKPESYDNGAGAGEQGSDKLVKRYKKDTPNQ